MNVVFKNNPPKTPRPTAGQVWRGENAADVALIIDGTNVLTKQKGVLSEDIQYVYISGPNVLATFVRSPQDFVRAFSYVGTIDTITVDNVK